MILAFADVEIDLGKGEIRRGGTAVRAAPRVVALLHLLAENADRIVTKDEIIEKIWDGRIISESAISTSIKEARQAIGDDGARQAFVRTMHGQGFRCIAEVRVLTPAAATTARDHPSHVEPALDLLSGKPSLAVLPFGNVASEGTPDPLGDGLAAELISALSRLRYISVTARGSSFRFRQSAPDLDTISKVLGVRYCLSGVVETYGPEFAITLELARTQDGVVIWSDRFSGPKENIHDVRSRIVAEVISALELHVPLNEAEAARLRAPDRLDAWAEYHLGLQHLFRFNPRDSLVAEERFKSAVAREPGFARAHAGLSFVSFQQAFMGYGDDPTRHKQEALARAEKSLELDLLDPFGNHCMGRAKWMEGDLDAADTWLSRSLEISPNFAQGHYLRSLIGTLAGKDGSMRDGSNLAMALSPLDPLLYAMMGSQALSYMSEERFDEAASWGQRAVQAPGSHYLLGMVCAAAHHLKGDHDKTIYWVDKTKTRRPDVTIGRFFEAFPFRPGPTRERMERALREAGF